MDPGLVLETASTQINITSNATPAWKAVYDMNFGGVLYTFLVPSSDSPNTPDRNIVAQTPTSAGMDQVSGIGVGEGTGGPMPFYQISDGTANYAVLENSSARMRIKITADLITFTTSDVGDVVEVLTFYPWKIVYDRNITLTSLSDMQTRSFASYFILNRTLDNVTLINNITITFIPDINETGDVPLPTNFSKIHGQMITANNTIINVLFNQIKQDMFQDDYVNLENVASLIRAHGFSENTTDIGVGNYRMINVVDINNDNTSNATAQLRFKDYQKPDSLVFSRGERVIDFGDDDSDGFNEREGIYAMNFKKCIIFNISNSFGITRFKPPFKIFNYTLSDIFPTILIKNSSGIFILVKDIDYNINFLNNDTTTDILITQYTGDIDETDQFTIGDCEPPSVFDLRPKKNLTISQGTRFNISAKVTDNVAVDKVKANVTFPNSSLITIDLFNSKDLLFEYDYNRGFITAIGNGLDQQSVNDWLNESKFISINSGSDSDFINASFTLASNKLPYLNFSFAYTTYTGSGGEYRNWDNLSTNLSIFNYTSNEYQLIVTNFTNFNLAPPNASFNCQVVKMPIRLYDDFRSNGRSNFTLIIETKDDNPVPDASNHASNCDGEIVFPPGSIQAGFVWVRIQPGHIYRSDFNDSSQLGQYNVSYFANDTSDNINDTEKTFFNVI
ncbi:MAG: hypothetical protein HYS80_00265 [Candidatus Aenigmarchaeota archaeon]|nr:hypothetical protein [Candidatus Aenigmarchaeota archaeon]